MSKFDDTIKNINKKITNLTITTIMSQLLKSWFSSLNQKDLEVFVILGTFLTQRISKLFSVNLSQLTNNNNQDLKAIVLLLLPYINDDRGNVYKDIKDLNELILTKEMTPEILKLERSEVLKSHFKFTNMGIGLFDINEQIDLLDKEYEKLIYKIIYHNFISLNETLSIVNGKLYVNWINIIPLNIETYKESNIYKNTIKHIDSNKKFNDENTIDLLEYDGLYIGEFYNVFRNIYYESIKKVKWLIFIIEGKYIIQYLNNKFNFDNFFDFNSFDDLDIKEKNKFEMQFKSITDYTIWKNIIVWFVNNYSNKKLITNKEILKPFEMKIENEGTDQELTKKSRIKFEEITNEQIKTLIDNIDPGDIWNFIKESLNILQSTIYSKYLIDNNKIINKLYLPNTKINLKNIYNIAKSLSHHSIEDWDILPVKYSSLRFDQKKDFWNKFNLSTSNIDDWISLRNNLKLEGFNNYEERLKEILDNFNEIKYKLVWEYLVYNGLLSDFKVNLLIEKHEIKTHIKKELDNSNYKESYYYLSNKKYSEHKFRVNTGNTENAEDISYLKNITKQAWYSFYAMNWVCQINFYHHYINHRVLYITGATGQGKSTQVPKLFMYALKMLDYKNNGRVICTQPRIGPTNTIANRISEELGVPIHEYSNTLKEKIKSDKYYVQFKHSNDDHKIDSMNHLNLTIITDGTLLSEIIKNPILKEEVKSKNEIVYTNKNKYDIIIIDEAHEHNTNMDLILTLVRQSLYMNNDIKLIIMSATMDDDEPNFRRYYHKINDNLVYPIRSFIEDSFTNKDILYDSIYLDRRFHIAPPGKGTQYDIKEIYLENGNTNDIVKNILESSTFGDILVFEKGTSDIMKRVKILNSITPRHVIAIPYLGTGLNQKYKDMIEDLKNNISKIRTSKKLVDSLWNEKYTVSNDVPEGTYTRAIIVATNVAEASLTIENLKYVIDNGFAKVNMYDEVKNEQILIEETISEASRKQRKGRVGRVSSGTVYYLYKKGDKESIKPKYKINQENFGENLLSLLETYDRYDAGERLMDYRYDPNIPDSFILESTEEEKLELRKTIFYKKNIYNIQETQFRVIEYKEYWNEHYFNTNDFDTMMYRKESGYQIDILLDIKGKFYIIHPKEHIIKRNILGNIIEYLDNKNKWTRKSELPSYIMSNIILNQSEKYFLVDISMKIYNPIFDNNINDMLLYKTEFFEYVRALRELVDSYDFDTADYVTLLTSESYGSFNEVLEVLSMLKVIKNSMKNLIIDMNIYNDQDNEIEFIHKIISNFKNKFNYFNLFNIKKNDTNLKEQYEKLKEQYKSFVDKRIEEYRNDRKIYNKDPPKKYSSKEWNKFNQLYLSGKLRNGFDYLISDLLESNDNINNFVNYIEQINTWASFNNINGSILIDYLYTYKKYYLKFMTIKKNDPKLDPLKEMRKEMSSFKKSLSNKNQYEKIIRPFIHGKPYNFGLRINSSDIFHTTIPPMKITNSHSKVNENNMIFYFNRVDYEMSITNKIEIEWLFKVLPIYYKPSNFKNIILSRNGDDINKYELKGDLFDNFCVELRNKWSPNNLPFESTEKEILKEFIKNIKKYAN